MNKPFIWTKPLFIHEMKLIHWWLNTVKIWKHDISIFQHKVSREIQIYTLLQWENRISPFTVFSLHFYLVSMYKPLYSYLPWFFKGNKSHLLDTPWLVILLLPGFMKNLCHGYICGIFSLVNKHVFIRIIIRLPVPWIIPRIILYIR